jgi:chromosome segregation ATPase
MNDVVVPNKSTISEEVIEVPYAKHDEDEEEIVMRPSSSQSQRREADVGNTRDSRQSSVRGHSRAEDRDYSRDARTSVASTSLSASRQQPPASVKPTLSASNSASDLIREQRVRGDLEAKLTGMERRLQGLEKELEDSGRRERWERERTRELEEEVRGLKERAGGHATSLRSVQQEVEDAQAALDAERQRAEGRRREDQAEIVNWRQKCDALEEEVQSLRQEQQLRTEQEVGVPGDAWRRRRV